MNDGERLDLLLAQSCDLPPEAAAAQTRLFFQSLDPDAAYRLADERREQVGELDGAPAALRYHANHLRLLAAWNSIGAILTAGHPSQDLRTRLETLEDLLTPVTALAVGEDGQPVLVDRYRQFLSLDLDGDGKVAEVLGDLATADNVAVLLPGMGNSLETLHDQSARGQAIQAEAGPDTATVVWLGYDSPDNVLQAVSKSYAYDAAPALRRFSAGLDTEIRPDAVKTLIGHSYGSVVAVNGLRHGASFDNLVLTGSPGIARDVHSVADLDLPGVRCFVARSPGDFIAYTQWHGVDPASYPDIVRLQTAGGVRVRFHQQYYRPNSESLRNIGRVVRGEYAAITTTDTSHERETRLVIPGLAWGPALRVVTAPVALAYDGVAALRGVTEPPRPRLIVSGRGEQVGHRPEGPSR
ncbi:MAG: alpha/beta hydrolase [Kribbellaceae bacterium]